MSYVSSGCLARTRFAAGARPQEAEWCQQFRRPPGGPRTPRRRRRVPLTARQPGGQGQVAGGGRAADLRRGRVGGPGRDRDQQAGLLHPGYLEHRGVDAVAQGEGYLSPAVSDAVLNDYRRHVTNPIDLLTSREREVLQMLAEGKTNKEIAVVLNLSVYTVDAHRGRIMEKLNVHSINELVRFAVRNGLVD